MTEIFEIENQDLREKFINKTLGMTQQARGKNVEAFTPDDGFVLLKNQSPLKYNMGFVKKSLSVAKLSMGAKLELREFYYSLRTSPDLVEAFKGCSAKGLYSEVLRAIMDTEILCDVKREEFTVGNLSKGFIFYYHSPVFGHKERKIAYTENIARKIMTPEAEEEWQCGNCENIIVVEKNSAATRLVELGISEFTNSIIVTVGGNFSRAIWELASRFKDSKNMIFLADADAYGVDMLRTIRVGTESSRHLSYKFNPKTYSKIHLAGFYPSIGEDLGLPNDEEQKRPLQNPYVKQRINFLLKYGLLDQRDLATWKRDKTYELESLSTAYKNGEGEPIGLGIYLIEYMRLKNLPVKPPMPPDDKLKEEFDAAAKAELKREIDEAISYPKFFWKFYQLLTDKKAELNVGVYESLLPEYEAVLAKIGPKEIKYHIFKQFEEDPKLAQYDLAKIAHKIKEKFDIAIKWALGEVQTIFEDAMENWEGPDFDTDVKFTPVHNEEGYDPNGYDLVLRRLGAKEEDVLKVREALKKRFTGGDGI